MEEQIEKIRGLVKSGVFNWSEIMRRVNRKGLSISSFENKLNPHHSQKFKQEDIDAIFDELDKIVEDLKKVDKSFLV